MTALAATWIFALLPLWFLLAFTWMAVGAVDVCRGIFREMFQHDMYPMPKFRLGGAAGVLCGLLMAMAPALAFNRVEEREGCGLDCSIFSDHRSATAWVSFQYVVAAAVISAVVWLITNWRGWRWMA